MEECSAALTSNYYGTSEFVAFLTMLALVYTLGRLTRDKLEEAEEFCKAALGLHKFHMNINLDPEIQLDFDLAEKLSNHANMCRTTARRLKGMKFELA